MSKRRRHHPQTLAAQLAPLIADRTPEYMPTLTLDRQIARARKEMGEERWSQLMAEWDEAA